MSISMKEESINAATARRYLERVKPEDQRKLSIGTVKKYAGAMLENKFNSLNGDTIKFDTANSLIDGQHRLQAVVKADVSIPMIILRGVAPEAKYTLDSGKTRTKADILQYAGFNLSTSAVAGVISSMVGKGIIGAVAREDIVALAYLHEEALIFVLDCFTKNIPSVTTAPVKANVARAFYTESKPRLREFSQVLMTGLPESKDDMAAVLLRNWLILQRHARTGAAVLEVYQKTQRALRAFLAREDLTRLYRVSEEQFRIPSL